MRHTRQKPSGRSAAYSLADTFISIQLYGFGGDGLLVSISGVSETIWGRTFAWHTMPGTLPGQERPESEQLRQSRIPGCPVA